jgi:hypothetical protein
MSTTAAVTTTTAAGESTAAITRRRTIRKNKTCDRCGIERRTMYTRQEPNSSFTWAEPYKELCPNCYLQEEEKEEKADKETNDKRISS